MDFFVRLVYSLYMKRILILGSCGAGKSTFAKRLHAILGIDIIHLDQHYWKSNWARTESEEWQKKVEGLVKGESWIMDGNYRSTMDLRLPKADTIIWLDFSPLVCFYRIVKRRLKNNRVDELVGCKERISFELLKWVLWKFPRDNRPDIAKRLEVLEGRKDIHILKSNKDVESFLASISK
jgi:adenylate kinase family enzyme